MEATAGMAATAVTAAGVAAAGVAATAETRGATAAVMVAVMDTDEVILAA